MTRLRSLRLGAVAAVTVVTALGGAAGALFGVCGPFTDVSDAAFCPFVLEIFTLGITTGTTATTYDPASNVSRLQMAAFLSRTVDGVLKRGGRRSALRQFWTAKTDQVPLTTLPGTALFTEFDGDDVWVSVSTPGRLSRVRSSDGKLLETWTGLSDLAEGLVVAMGKVFVAAQSFTPGTNGMLYRIDPSLPAGAATTVASGLAHSVYQLAFDGERIWITNQDVGTVSIVTPGATIPWTVTTTASGYQDPLGILYDGANVWITDFLGFTPNSNLLKLSASGGVLQTVTVGRGAFLPVFDGSNIWVPNFYDHSVSVVRASSGATLATLTGNGLDGPVVAAFDGQRVLLTNQDGNSVSLFKAADLSPLGFFPMPMAFTPAGVCGDGVNFWIVLGGVARLARF